RLSSLTPTAMAKRVPFEAPRTFRGTAIKEKRLRVARHRAPGEDVGIGLTLAADVPVSTPHRAVRAKAKVRHADDRHRLNLRPVHARDQKADARSGCRWFARRRNGCGEGESGPCAMAKGLGQRFLGQGFAAMTAIAAGPLGGGSDHRCAA